MSRWWERYPGRLEAEIGELRADGIVVSRDATAFESGKVRLQLELPDGYWLSKKLIAEYPDLYPFTRPEVYAPDFLLPHHQNPILKNLCLLGRESENWLPTWTLARLLREQLPKLRRAQETADLIELATLEVEQGEPVTDFLEYDEESIVLIDSDAAVPVGQFGPLAIWVTENAPAFRGRVCAIADETGKEVWSAPRRQSDVNLETIVGAWVRVEGSLTEYTADSLFESLEQTHPGLQRLNWQRDSQIIAVMFREELAHRESGTGWAFLLRRRTNGKGKRKGVTTHFVRTGRCGVGDMAARYPEFRHLQSCGIAVFGLGCIGAPSALDFARAGFGTIRMLESDVVEAGTTVRWPFGLSAAGRRKVKRIFDEIDANYPWVRTLYGAPSRVGQARQAIRDSETLPQMFDGIDAVYDATAEPGIQYLLSTLAAEAKLPYICVSGTNGGWGGIVARFNHRKGQGCWACFQAQIDHEIVGPPADPAGQVQPTGCSRVTYEGANFDLAEVALQGIRTAIATVLARKGATQNDFEFDVAVVELRDEHHRRIPPRWRLYNVEPRPDCAVCGSVPSVAVS
jgi:hypothetical protein